MSYHPPRLSSVEVHAYRCDDMDKVRLSVGYAPPSYPYERKYSIADAIRTLKKRAMESGNIASLMAQYQRGIISRAGLLQNLEID